jgi:hypothetical protein
VRFLRLKEANGDNAELLHRLALTQHHLRMYDAALEYAKMASSMDAKYEDDYRKMVSEKEVRKSGGKAAAERARGNINEQEKKAVAEAAAAKARHAKRQNGGDSINNRIESDEHVEL